MPESSSPLSDCISRCLEHHTRKNDERFFQVFVCSQLGVIVTGVPHGTSGRKVLGKGQGLGVNTAPDGKKTILACADPGIYAQRFTHPFNAEIDAIELLKAAWSMPSC